MPTRYWPVMLPLTGLFGLAPLHPTATMVSIAVTIFLIVKSETLAAHLSGGGTACAAVDS